MQRRLNQFRSAKRAAPTAKIFDTQIRDAMVVRRAVALGLPVALVSAETAEGEGDNVINDYRKLARELIDHIGA
jgi:chromosome partitioning protein